MTQTPDTLEGAESWIANYKKKFGADPGPYSTQSYDAVRRRRRGHQEGRQHRRRQGHRGARGDRRLPDLLRPAEVHRRAHPEQRRLRDPRRQGRQVRPAGRPQVTVASRRSRGTSAASRPPAEGAPVTQLIWNGLFVGSFYALVALGYSMVYGIIKLLNFAHGDLYMLGAFVGLRDARRARRRRPLGSLLAAVRRARADDAGRPAWPASRSSGWPTGRCAGRRGSRC